MKNEDDELIIVACGFVDLSQLHANHVETYKNWLH